MSRKKDVKTDNEIEDHKVAVLPPWMLRKKKKKKRPLININQ